MTLFTSLQDRTKAIMFTLLVLLLALIFSLLPGINSFAYMVTPTLAVLIMMLVVTRDGYRKPGWKALGLHKLGLRGWLFAICVPIVPLAVGYGIAWGTGLSSLEIGEDFAGFSWSVFPLIVLFLFVKATLFESMGEELGWRGYLLPLMTRCTSKNKAMMLNGVIHGLWHFPIMLNTNAYHSEEKLWLILPLALLSTMFLAPVIGELRLRTGSVWTASIMHTSHNLVWLILANITLENSEASKYISGDMSIVVVVFYAGLTWLLWKKSNKMLKRD